MNGHHFPTVGPEQRQVIGVDGDFVLVQEIWNSAAADFPMCGLPRGAAMPPQVGRHVVMYRAEAQKMGLLG